MSLPSRHLFATLMLTLLLISSPAVNASSISFSGNLANESDVQFFNFSIAADSTSLMIQTFSLLGGINAAGDSITGGGFDPYLALFDSAGNWVTDTNGKNPGEEALISVAGGLLAAGDYTLALAETGNLAMGTHISEGFATDFQMADFQQPDYALQPFRNNGGYGGNQWALDISLTETPPGVTEPLTGSATDIHSVPVPTPASLILLLMGWMVLAVMNRRKMSILATPCLRA